MCIQTLFFFLCSHWMWRKYKLWTRLMMRHEGVRDSDGVQKRRREEVINSLGWLKGYKEQEGSESVTNTDWGFPKKNSSNVSQKQKNRTRSKCLQRGKEEKVEIQPQTLVSWKRSPPQDDPLFFFLLTFLTPFIFSWRAVSTWYYFPSTWRTLLSISCTEGWLTIYFLHFLLSKNISVSPFSWRLFAERRSLG